MREAVSGWPPGVFRVINGTPGRKREGVARGKKRGEQTPLCSNLRGPLSQNRQGRKGTEEEHN